MSRRATAAGVVPSPLLLGLAASLCYAALASFFLARYGWHLSRFVIAGDFYVDPHRVLGPLDVGRRSYGYDGQFYYRMAVAPLSFQAVAGGVRFDDPAYRMGRIGFPLVVWLVTGGRAALVAPAMIAVNLLGVGAIAAFSVTISRALRLAPVTPLLVVLWYGFDETLTHDTTEIAAAAFLLGAIAGRVAGRPVLYALAGAAAALSRETTILVLGGILVTDLARSLPLGGGGGRGGGSGRFAVAGIALLVPFAAWHELLPAMWHRSAGGIAGNLGLPFAGAIAAIRRDVAALPVWAGPGRLGRFLWPADRLAIDLGLGVFFIAVLLRLPAAFRRGGMVGALALGWLLEASLMSTLTAGGPWIDPTAIGRAFTETWVVGCLVLGAAPLRWPRAAQGRVLAAGFATAMFLSGVVDVGSFLDTWGRWGAVAS